METGADAPNSACKSTVLENKSCKVVEKNNKKKCAGNGPADDTATPPTIDNPAMCDSTPLYDYPKMKTIVGKFLKKDYLYDIEKVKADKALKAFTEADETLKAETFSIKLICDKKKWTFTEYDDLKCEADKPKEYSAEWGQCVASPDGGFIKVTGAMALKAAAAALVAFAGSQF